MLVRVEVRNSQGALLDLPLDDDSSGLYIENIDGLDPVKATLVSTSTAGADGAQYQNSRREARNLVVKMGVEPDWINTTVTDLRKRLYAFFMPKTEAFLRFYMDDGLYVDITGRVESFDFPLFTKDPEANLSLMCFQPDFIDPNPVNLSKMSVSDVTEFVVQYDGTVETGVVWTIRPDRAVGEFTLYHRRPDGQLRTLEFTKPLAAGDKLEISTVTGAKGVTLTRSSTQSSALYGVSPQSNWLEFQPGDNFLRLYASGAAFPFDLSYTTRYGGL